jgi:hypothetical protein
MQQIDLVRAHILLGRSQFKGQASTYWFADSSFNYNNVFWNKTVCKSMA